MMSEAFANAFNAGLKDCLVSSGLAQTGYDSAGDARSIPFDQNADKVCFELVSGSGSRNCPGCTGLWPQVGNKI